MDRPPPHQLTDGLQRLRSDAAGIVASAVAAVSPRALVPPALRDASEVLASRGTPVSVLAVGKAGAAMFAALAGVTDVTLADSLVIGPRRPAVWDDRHPFVVGGHPFADAGSIAGGSAALALARRVPADGCLLCLLSGGASALMASPAPGLTLAAKQAVVAMVMKGGGDIRALNAVRKHLSAIKGGRLAAACPGRVVTLAISDVIGDDLSVIGSGPGVPDTSTWEDAHAAVRRFSGDHAPDASVAALLDAGRAGLIEDTPKPGDPRLARAVARVIGGRRVAMDAAAAAAGRLGYHPIVVSAPVSGEARLAAQDWWREASARLAHTSVPTALVSSGETTVTVRGAGRGGRNQEFAVALVDGLDAAAQPMVVASIGTDGVDGPTDAAGALVDNGSASRARAKGLEPPAAWLERNDSYPFLEATGDLICTGASDTNVGDIQVLLMRPH